MWVRTLLVCMGLAIASSEESPPGASPTASPTVESGPYLSLSFTAQGSVDGNLKFMLESKAGRSAVVAYNNDSSTFEDGKVYSVEVGNYGVLGWDDSDNPASIFANFSTENVINTLYVTDMLAIVESEVIDPRYLALKSALNGSRDEGEFTLLSTELNITVTNFTDVSESSFPLFYNLSGVSNATLSYLAIPFEDLYEYNTTEAIELVYRYGGSVHVPTADGSVGGKVVLEDAYYSSDASMGELCGNECRARRGLYQSWLCLTVVDWNLGWYNLTVTDLLLSVTYDLTAPSIKANASSAVFSYPGNLSMDIEIDEPGTYWAFAQYPGFVPDYLGSNNTDFVNYAFLNSYSTHEILKDGADSTVTLKSIELNSSAFVFGSDFSYSSFDLYFFAQDDGIADKYGLNNASGFEEYLEFMNITAYTLIDGAAKIEAQDLANSINYTDWIKASVAGVDSTDDSELSYIINVSFVEPSMNYTTEFGSTLPLKIQPLYEQDDSSFVVMAVYSSDPDEALPSMNGDFVAESQVVIDGSENYYPFYMIGQNDGVADGDQTVTVNARLLYASDSRFELVPENELVTLSFKNLELTNYLQENYDPTFTVSYDVDYTTESGGTATLYVSMNEAPQANVHMGVAVSDLDEAMISGGNNPLLIFTPDSYTNKEVILEGVSDDTADGDVYYDVIFSVIQSSDPYYAKRYSETHFTQTMTNRDDADTRIAASLEATSCWTSEEGKTCTFSVVLCPRVTGLSECASDLLDTDIFDDSIDHVTVTLEIDDITEGVFSSAYSNGRAELTTTIPTDGSTLKLLFREDETTGPYRAYVNVTGVDDSVDDGDKTFTVSVTDAFIYNTDDTTTSIIDQTDGIYVSSLTYTNYDDDVDQYLSLTPSTCYTSESGSSCLVSLTADFDIAADTLVSDEDSVDCVSTTVTIGYNLTNFSGSDLRLSDDSFYLKYNSSEANWLDEAPFVVFDTTDFFGVNVSVYVDRADFPQPNDDGLYVFAKNFSKNESFFGALLYNTSKEFCLPLEQYTVLQGNNGTQINPLQVWSDGWFVKITNPVSLLEKQSGLTNLIYNNVSEVFTVLNATNVTTNVNGTEVVTTIKEYKNVTRFSLVSKALTPNFNVTINANDVPFATPTSLMTRLWVYNYTENGLELGDMTISPAGSVSKSITSMANASVLTGYFNFTDSAVLSFNVSSVDDDVDDDDAVFKITALPVRIESKNGIFYPNSYSLIRTNVVHYDDDTAGIYLESVTGETLYAYRDDRSPPSDAAESARRFLDMQYNMTSESGNTTSFSVALTSEPLSNVTLRVTAATTTNNGYTRMEGYVMNSSYNLIRESVSASWLTGSIDTVTNPDTGYLDLTFSVDDWAEKQWVTIAGLDDQVDDGDQSYIVSITPVDSNTDPYYAPDMLKAVKVPLVNVDDDESGFVAWNTSYICSEPYYDLDAEVKMYITSQPLDDIVVKVTSSMPNEAGPDTNFVVFTPENFQSARTITVSSIDDFVKDGDIDFTTTVSLVSSGDDTYSESVDFDYDFSMISKDDPNDVQATASAAVIVELDDDSASYTTEDGDSVTVNVYLNSTPQELVFISVTTSDSSEAIVDAAPTALVFTGDNYDVAQSVTVTGLADSIADGDVPYYFVASISSTTDPYYAALGVGTSYTVGLTNRDLYYNRVRVDMRLIDNQYLQEGDSMMNTTTLQVRLCLAQRTVDDDVDDDKCESIADEDLFDAGVDRVVVKVALSDTTEAIIQDLDQSQVLVEYDGSEAKLTFDSSSTQLTKNLTLQSVDDDLVDGSQSFTVSVSDAWATVGRVQYTISSEFLPSDVTSMTLDDDSDRFAYADPSVNYVAEDGTTSDVLLYFNFSRGVVGKTNVTLAASDVSVYIQNVTALQTNITTVISATDYYDESGRQRAASITSTCYDCDGILPVARVTLAMADNNRDDGDTVTYATVSTAYAVLSSSSSTSNETTSNGTSTNGTSTNGTSTNGTSPTEDDFTIPTRRLNSGDGDGLDWSDTVVTSTLRINALDDDTAGIMFTQSNFESAAYRNPTTDALDADDGIRTVALPWNATSESGTNVTFDMALTSKPSASVYVSFTSNVFSDKWGDDRMEGIPYGSSYVVEQYISTADWVSGTKDSVSNPHVGNLTLEFTPANWNITQTVTILGLDDYAEDGDQDYVIFGEVSSPDGDAKYSSSYFTSPIRIPLLNEDDDTASFVIMQNGTQCSEPVYGMDAELQFYTTTEPYGDIAITFSSLKPWEADVSDDLVTISPKGWDNLKTVTISSVDDFLNDGDIDFTVRMSLLSSLDDTYDSLITTQTFSYTSLDDPSDVSDTSTASLTFSFADDSETTTTELGGEVELQVVGTLKPIGRVVYSISVVDTTEGNILYPAVLVLTPTNYDSPQSVIVKGVSDTISDGDTEYDVRFDLISSADPYYENLGTVKYTLTNTEVVQDRIAVGINGTDCYSTTEGAGNCVVQLEMCLTAEGRCKTRLSASEIYDLGVYQIVVNATMADPNVAFISGPDNDFVSVSSDGSTATIIFESDTNFETTGQLLVAAYDDSNFDGTQSTSLSFDGVIRVGSASSYSITNISEFYNGTVAIEAHDNEAYDITMELADSTCTTSEEGDECEVYVTLGAMPSSDVTLSFTTPSDVAEFIFEQGTEDDDSCTFCTTTASSTASFNFTSDDWYETRVILVTGLDDSVYEPTGFNNYLLNVTATSNDKNYSGAFASVALQNVDNDVSTLEVYQGSSALSYSNALSVDENGLSREFRVRLANNLAAGEVVIVDISVSDTTEGSVSKEILIFGSENASEWQHLNYTGVDDKVKDGNVDFLVYLGPLRGSGVDDDEVGGTYEFKVTNYDNELISLGSLSRRRELTAVSATYEIYESEDDGDTEDSFSISFPDWQTGSVVSYTSAVVTMTFDATPGTHFSLSFDDAGSTALLGQTCSDGQTAKTCTATFNSPNQQFDVFMTAVDDMIDYGDQVFNITLSTEVFFTNQAGSSSTTAEPVLVQLKKYEDDTAGFFITQVDDDGNRIFSQTVYKSLPRGQEQPTDKSESVVKLSDSVTEEAAGSRDGNITFYVKLLSEPNGTVEVQAVPQFVSFSDGSDSRYEGVPVPNLYNWTKNHYSHLNQSEDVIPYATEGHRTVTFDSSNWNESVMIEIRGINDLYDDSTVDYNITLETSGQDSIYDEDMPDVTLPLTNLDDDTVGIAYEWASGNTVGQTSEPYYDLSDTLYYWLTAQPLDNVLLGITSSDPTNGVTSVAVTVVSPIDWTEIGAATVSSVDDEYADGDVDFDITIAVIFSVDDNYGSTDKNTDGTAGLMSVEAPAISIDDPDDADATACQKGEYGLYDTGASSTCEDCPAGRFAEDSGDKVNCRACPPGTFGIFTGASGFAETEDWDGTLLYPGCLPCPNGTYQDEFNATSCKLCSSDEYCGMASVSAKDDDVYATYADSFANAWKTIDTDEFELKTYNIWNNRVEDMNQSQYEAYCLSVGFFAWCLTCIGVALTYSLATPPKRQRMIKFFRQFDLFSREHIEEAKDEDHADLERAPSALGGIVSIAVLVLTLILVALMVVTFVSFNTSVLVALSLYPDAFRESIVVGDLVVSVDFVGFSGCRADQYLPLSNKIDGSTVPTMSYSGFSFTDSGSSSTSYECIDGDLRMIQQFKGISVDTTPEVSFYVESDCQSCESTSVDPLTEGNTVYYCPPCSLASAQAFAFTVEATNLYPAANKVHGDDNNTVSGTLTPSARDTVFYGDTETTVSINLMPTEYRNYQTGEQKKGYRIIFSDTVIGSEASFSYIGDGITYYGQDDDIDDDVDVTTSANYESLVVDNTFVDVDTENAVGLTVRFPLTVSKLSIEIDDISTFQDFIAELGGLFGAIAGIFIVFMHYLERSYDQEDHMGKLKSTLMVEMVNMKEKLHEAMYPEPEVWQMENISRLERKEKKRSGGQEEDDAVKNFKDLLERSKVEGDAGGDHEEYGDDYEEEGGGAAYDFGHL